MFTGSHVVIFSNDAEADRALMGKLMGGRAVDAGEGWMIYAMPPAEIAVHPPYGDVRCEFHMMCDDIEATRAKLADLGLASEDPQDLGYGIQSGFTLPGGARIGFYQPRHQTAI